MMWSPPAPPEYPITGLLKDWAFRLTEPSPGRYRLDGIRRSGETVSEAGSDRTGLVLHSVRRAQLMDESYLNPQPEPFKHHYFNTDIPDTFPQALCAILLEEILLGNWIQDTWTGFGTGVMLARPFMIPRHSVEPPLEYAAVNDPHYWKEEIRLPGTEFLVAAAFGRPPSPETPETGSSTLPLPSG